MTRLAYCIAPALLLTALSSSYADARNNHVHSNPSAFVGARNQAAPTDRPKSDMEMRQQCYQDAAKQVSSANQDLQTVRDYVYRNCAFDHGMRP